MAHRLVDVEITAPLPDLALAPDEAGVGLVVRHHGRPVGFVIEDLPAGHRLAAADLDRIIGRADAIGLVRAALGEELAAASPAPSALASPSSASPSVAAAPSITVAVCTKDRPQRLARCLDALLASADTAPGPPGPEDDAADDRATLDVLVVDNAPSDDATRDLVAARPGVRYAREPAAGLDFARNRALAEAAGEVLAFLDDDVVVEDGYVAGLRAAWRDDPDAGGITGLVLPYELATGAQVAFERRGGFRRGFHRIRWEGDRLPGNRLYPFGAGMFGAGCNMSFRRALVAALGGFDEALDTGRPLPGGGDIDMFFRVLRAGWPLVYAPGVVVRHEHRRTHDDLRHQYYTWGTGSMAFLAKWYRRVPPEDRRTIRRLWAWWFGKYQPGLLARGLAGRRGMTVDLALAELRGGVVGLAGEYGRSRRRTARIAAAVGHGPLAVGTDRLPPAASATRASPASPAASASSASPASPASPAASATRASPAGSASPASSAAPARAGRPFPERGAS